MKKLAVLVASAALLTFTPAATSAVRADPAQRLRFGVAKNWAGYAAHGGPFTSASTSWREPSIACTGARSGVASFAGIDGDGTPTVEQVGTVDLCRSGGAVARHAFYEMFPKGAVFIKKTVRANDAMSASVVANSSSSFTLTLVDTTQNWTFTTNQQASNAQLGSAEAITEAPTARGSGIVPLSNFGTINYSGTTANGQPLGNLGPEAITMVGNGGVIKAAPGGISGGSFSVTWHHA